MGVNLGGSDIGMAEHHLDRAEVGAMGEKMGGEGMADHVRRDIFGDAGCQGRFPDDLPETQPGHRRTPGGDEEEITAPAAQDRRPTMFQIGFDLVLGLDAEGDESLLAALANYPDKAGGKIACGQRQGDQFGDAESGGVEEKEHGPVAAGQWRTDGGWRQQPVDFGQRQGFGQNLAAFRQIDDGKGIAADVICSQQKGEEMLNGGDSSGIAAVADAVFPCLFEKAVDNRDVNQFEFGD